MSLTLGCSLTAVAQKSAEQWFEEANAVYNAGRYDTAIVLYNHVVEADMESVALYYNMGNAHYKMRNYPMAIYFYEKALKLDPSNDDVKNNLAIANLAIVDKIEEMPQSFLAKGWRGMRNALSGSQWTWLSLVAFGLLLVSAFLFLRGRKMGWRKLGFFAGIIIALVFALSVLFAAQMQRDAAALDHAIIITPTVTVKSTPNEASVDLFVLHEGTKVEILDHADGWNKVKIANGSIGWLQAEAMLPF